jgi:hypothetical protein
MHMRRGEWAEAAKVIGIECVGLVKSCPGGEFPIGTKVAALMGGLGRTINGSYARVQRRPTSPSSAVLCSAHRVFPLSDVPLQEIAREVAARRLKAKPARVFRFEEIREAYRAMEASYSRHR